MSLEGKGHHGSQQSEAKLFVVEDALPQVARILCRTMPATSGASSRAGQIVGERRRKGQAYHVGGRREVATVPAARRPHVLFTFASPHVR